MADDVDVAVVTILQPTSVISGHNLHIITSLNTQPIKLEKLFLRLNLWIGRHIIYGKCTTGYFHLSVEM